MANLTVKLNQTEEWTCAGTGDVLTCSDLSRPLRTGVQCETDFDMHTSNVTVTLVSGIEKDVSVAEADANCALIGKDFQVAAISITGVSAGTYTVRFSM